MLDYFRGIFRWRTDALYIHSCVQALGQGVLRVMPRTYPVMPFFFHRMVKIAVLVVSLAGVSPTPTFAFYPVSEEPPGTLFTTWIRYPRHDESFSTYSWGAIMNQAKTWATAKFASYSLPSVSPDGCMIYATTGPIQCTELPQTDFSKRTISCYQPTARTFVGSPACYPFPTRTTIGDIRATYLSDVSPINIPEGGPCCDGYTNTCSGNPCDASNGNKYEYHEDFHGGPGIPSFGRAFNSIAVVPRNSSLGINWTHTYAHSVQLDAAGDMVYTTRAQGKQHIFKRSTAGVLTTRGGLTDTLTQQADGWTYRQQNGVSEKYSPSGQLISETSTDGKITTLGYTAGKLTTITGPYGHTLTLGYDTAGRLATLTDPTGRVTRYGYDTSNNLATVTYPDNSGIQYHYENPAFTHHLTGVSNVNASGSVTRFSTFDYNAAGLANLTQHAQTSNGAPQEKVILTYTYTGDRADITDASGNREVMSFNTISGLNKLVSKVSMADNKILLQNFDTNANLICSKDEEGHVVLYGYNTTHQRTSQTDNLFGTCPYTAAPPATARTTTTQYLTPTLDIPTLITTPSVAPGLVKRTVISYSDTRFPTLPSSITQSGFTPTGLPVSRSVALSYNARGQVASINGPRSPSNPGMNGLDDVTTLAYYDCATGSACGQLKSVTNAAGHTTTYNSYYADGRLEQQTDPSGLLTYYFYDTRGRVWVEYQYRPNGAVRNRKYTYTAFNQVKTVTVSPDNITYTYAYDAAQDLKSITDTLGNSVNYTYDVKGNRTTTWYASPGNRLNQFTDKTFNLRNQVESLSQGGYFTTLINDAVGNLTQEIDPNHTAVASTASTVHQYDALNRLFQTTDLLNGTARYTYDTNDRVTQVTTPNQAGTTTAYDDLGNLLQEISPDRGTTTYTYDAAGNVLSTTDARNVTVKYTYDPLNRRVFTDYPSTPDITTTYDITPGCTHGLGQVCTTQDGTQTVNYTYDPFEHLAQQTTTLQGKVYTTTYTRDPWGRVTGLTYPGGRVITTPRDGRGHITGITATVNGVATTLISNRTVRADGLLQSQTLGNGLADSRLYNYAGRLTTQSLGSLDTRVYGYDHNGNLTRKQTLPEVATYGYDVLNQLTQDNDPTPETLTYGTNSNGNRQTRNTQSYGYQSNSNRLTSVAGASVVYDTAGNIKTHPITGQTYNYNEAGQLSGVIQTGNLVAFYRYNPQGLRTLKFDSQGILLYHYDDNGHLIQETDTTGSLIRAYVWADDMPIAQITKTPTGEVLTYLHTDHQQTPRLATNTLGKVVWRYEGNAFGDTLPNEDVDGDAIKTTMNLRFAGQYYDQETGLHYNWHRYYEPRFGRYITSDPIGLAGGLNTYTYVLNNPLRYVDPLGLFVGGPRPIPGRIAYERARQLRTLGHTEFPGEQNSDMRHCVVSCILAGEQGTGIARTAGVVNELQGAILHDIPNIASRIRGDSPMALQRKDLQANEKGFTCSKGPCRQDSGGSETKQECIICCARP